MRKLARFLLILAVLASVLVGIARAVAIRWWQVPDDDPYLEASIAPTLRGGDRVLLWRRTAPMFGDLVVCPEPGKPDRVVIARIAGVDGDTVEVKGTNVFVNGRRARTEGSCAESPFRVVDPDPRTSDPVEQPCEREELGSRVHLRGNAIASRPLADVKMAVGEGQVFLLSDNRLFPYDSRDFGLVERATCTEKVVFRLTGKAGFGDVQSRLTFIR